MTSWKLTRKLLTFSDAPQEVSVRITLNSKAFTFSNCSVCWEAEFRFPTFTITDSIIVTPTGWDGDRKAYKLGNGMTLHVLIATPLTFRKKRKPWRIQDRVDTSVPCDKSIPSEYMVKDAPLKKRKPWRIHDREKSDKSGIPPQHLLKVAPLSKKHKPWRIQNGRDTFAAFDKSGIPAEYLFKVAPCEGTAFDLTYWPLQRMLAMNCMVVRNKFL